MIDRHTARWITSPWSLMLVKGNDVTVAARWNFAYYQTLYLKMPLQSWRLDKYLQEHQHWLRYSPHRTRRCWWVFDDRSSPLPAQRETWWHLHKQSSCWKHSSSLEFLRGDTSGMEIPKSTELSNQLGSSRLHDVFLTNTPLIAAFCWGNNNELIHLTCVLNTDFDWFPLQSL